MRIKTIRMIRLLHINVVTEKQLYNIWDPCLPVVEFYTYNLQKTLSILTLCLKP